jgi:cation diffusion facilitator CzcD-associated flavoprotein CzcO
MAQSNQSPQNTNTLDAIVIGAGFSGLYALHRLRDDLSMNTLVLEAGEGVGGTWYWNRYPGARCDSESHGYAYFFSRELHEAWQWSERYPGHAEIREYLNFVAERLDLKRDIRFGQTVTSCKWDGARWVVSTDAGENYSAPWLITAVGCLSSANVPDIPGLDSFAGQWVHTGQWPHEGVDFTAKRVGQIGTGSTGIQAAPVIAETAGHLTVFQRTANFSVPARNGPWDAEYADWVRTHYEEIKALVLSTPNAHPFRISPNKAMEVSDRERTKMYERAWEKGGLRFRGVFQDLLLSQDANDTAAEFIKGKIRETVKDPETARMLSDIDHPYAAKRPPIDTRYFETFNRPNVSLVDVRSDPIAEITPEGLRLQSGAEHALDILVFATGFDAMTGPLLRLGIEGRDGLRLSDYWSAGPVSYLGLAMPGFPNLFTVTGPGSPSVLANMPVPIEQHVDWITETISTCRADGVKQIEAEEQAAADWVDHVREAAFATLLPEAGHSWYWGANVPGKPRVFMPYAGGMVRYREICARVAEKGHAGFLKSGAIEGAKTQRMEYASTQSDSPGV